VKTDWGSFNAHHYRHSPTMSTFIVECDPATWERAGFAAMNDDQTRWACERVFADALVGHQLVSNRSIWRQFSQVSNERWSVGNRVLVGDAPRTAHFSIGSGTRLAFEDAIALAKALRGQPDVRAALQAYEAGRRPVVDKLLSAAHASAHWYEDFAAHMRLEPWALAWSYLQRCGRIDGDKLRSMSPRFVAGYEAWVSSQPSVRQAAHA
jgi:2-polyprenyl-6-methoxyphenol hydroxylase-like FAD-dependent oxidoreductase